MISTLFELGASMFDSVLCVIFIAKYLHIQKNKKIILTSSIAVLSLFVITLLGDFFGEDFSLLITVSLWGLLILIPGSAAAIAILVYADRKYNR